MILPADPVAIARAAASLKKGGLVAFPTETVYGLGADATQAKAVAQIFELKGRPRFDPLIVHVASFEAAKALWARCPPDAEKLMKRFWPGPLTLVLPKTSRIPDIVTAGLSTVAVRMPDHPVAQALLSAVGRSLAAPSANRFGQSSPTTAQAVEEELGKKVAILDGGATRVGIESTVVMFEGDRPVLLRPGGVPLESVTHVVGPVSLAQPESKSASPGMLTRHYAPRKPLYLLEEVPVDLRQSPHWHQAPDKLGLLLLAPVHVSFPAASVLVLSQRGDLIEAAAHFFQFLRRLDQSPIEAILATPIPKNGLGLALVDRLSRAASGWARLNKGKPELLERPALAAVA